MSRNYLIFVLLVSIISIGVFGFLGMGGHQSCLAATFEGMPVCPAQGAGFDDALFHIEVFKSFSQAVSVAAVVLLLLIVLMIAGAWFMSVHLPALVTHAQGTVQLEEIHLRSRRRMQQWLAILEKRDPESGFMGA